MAKLSKSFYLRSANDCAKDFLGKHLVYNSPKGTVSGMINDVEAYPAFVDKVSHGNKKTKRTQVLYEEGGKVYVYLIYGLYHQFAIVVNKKDVPEVVFIRSIIPERGIKIMQKNFGKIVKHPNELTNSPGKLCKSLGINLTLYGTDITGNTIYLNDGNTQIKSEEIVSTKRIGINEKLEGNQNKLRFYFKNQFND